MSKEEPQVERLVADIPVELKRRIAAAAALRGMHVKDLLINIAAQKRLDYIVHFGRRQ